MDNKQIFKMKLSGEAEEGSIRAIDGNGQLIDPGQAICPILKKLPNEEMELIGTGFFISNLGIFATAKHVLMDVINDNGSALGSVGVIQFLPDNKFEIRSVMRFTTSAAADVAVGVLRQKFHKVTHEPLKNKIVTMTYDLPNVGERACTYAYPNTTIENTAVPRKTNFHTYPDYYDGKIIEYLPNGRDRVFLPAPCFQTSIHIHGRASGGPVFNSSGKVCGINSTGFNGMPDVSFISRIQDILPLKVTEIKIPGQNKEEFTIAELSEMGHIVFSKK